MTALRIAFDYLRFHRGRSLTLLACVSVAFLAYGVLGAFRYSLQSGEESVSGRRLIVTHRDGLMQTLPLAHGERIAALPGVAHWAHATWQGAYFRDPRELLMALAVAPEAWLQQHPDMRVDPAARADFLQRRNGLLASEALAQRFGWKPGDSIPLKSILYAPPAGEPAWTYVLSGTFVAESSGGARNYIITHYDYLNEARPMWKDTVGTYMVTPAPGISPAALAQAIDALFADGAAPTSSTTDHAFHLEFFSQSGDFLGMIRAVLAVAFVSLMLVLVSSQALAMRQIARDLGVLKVLGYSDLRVVAMVFAQVGVLMVAGAALGLALGALVNRVVTRQLPQFLPDLLMPLPVVAEGLALALVLAAAASVLPAWLALRVRPVEAFAMEQG